MRWLIRCSTYLLLTTAAGCAPVGTASEGQPREGPLLPSLQIYTETGEVNFVLQVTNTGDRALELRFPDGQTHDFTVVQGDREIWRWSDGQMFTQALRTESLGIGESLRLEGHWTPPPGLRGELIGAGQLMAGGGRVELATRFTLP